MLSAKAGTTWICPENTEPINLPMPHPGIWVRLSEKSDTLKILIKKVGDHH